MVFCFTICKYNNISIYYTFYKDKSGVNNIGKMGPVGYQGIKGVRRTHVFTIKYHIRNKHFLLLLF